MLSGWFLLGIALGSLVVIFGIQILYAIFVIFVLPSEFGGTDFDTATMEHLGQFGDTFGGVNAFFTGIGFIGILATIILQYRELRYQHTETQSRNAEVGRQLQLLTESTDAQTKLTQSQIYQNSKATLYDVTKYFVDHPEYRPYFYDTKPITEQDADYARLYALAELFVDGMDDLIVNKEYMPNAVEWDLWIEFFRYTYRQSPILQKYMKDNASWYGPALLDTTNTRVLLGTSLAAGLGGAAVLLNLATKLQAESDAGKSEASLAKAATETQKLAEQVNTLENKAKDPAKPDPSTQDLNQLSQQINKLQGAIEVAAPPT